MTYTIRLKGIDGGAGIESVSGHLPEGEWELTGHDDGVRASIQVRQRDPQGRFVIAAHHYRDRAEEALHEAEETAEVITGTGGEAAIGVAVAGEVPGE